MFLLQKLSFQTNVKGRRYSMKERRCLSYSPCTPCPQGSDTIQSRSLGSRPHGHRGQCVLNMRHELQPWKHGQCVQINLWINILSSTKSKIYSSCDLWLHRRREGLGVLQSMLVTLFVIDCNKIWVVDGITFLKKSLSQTSHSPLLWPPLILILLHHASSI